MDARWRARVGNAFLLVVFVLLLGRAVRQVEPVHNWDMLGYMALALEWTEDDPVEVHRRTYAAAAEELPAPVFAGLAAANAPPTSPGHVRRMRFEDPAAFTEHLAFYRARILYTLPVRVLHALGAPLSAAPWWIALGSFAATGLLLLYWAARHLPFPLAALLAAALVHAPPLPTTAGYATADALATLVTCAGLLLFVEGRTRLGAGVLVLSILVRPDSIVLALLLAAAAFFLERGPWRPDLRTAGAWVAASVLCYLGVQAYADAYPWWVLFHISFVEKAVHPGQLATSVDPGVYARVLGEKLAEIPGSGYFANPRGVTGSTFVLLMAALGALGIALARRAPEDERLRRGAVTLAALLAAYVVRWLLFPQLWDRFFAVLYVAVPMIVLGMVLRALREPEGGAGEVEPGRVEG